MNHDTVKMSLAAFARRENCHINAYIRLLKNHRWEMHTQREWMELREQR